MSGENYPSANGGEKSRLAWGSALHGGGEIRPLLHPEGADVPDAAGEPGHGFEGGDGGEEAGEVLVRGEIDAALHAFEPVAGEGGADIGIGLGDALGAGNNFDASGAELSHSLERLNRAGG